LQFQGHFDCGFPKVCKSQDGKPKHTYGALPRYLVPKVEMEAEKRYPKIRTKVI
jgi:hypothetical protein